MEPTSSGKHRCINALASEVARHQQFRKAADFKCNSRRLHFPHFVREVFGVSRLVQSAPSALDSATPAASMSLPAIGLVLIGPCQ